MSRVRIAISIGFAITLGAGFRPATARELSITHVTVVSAERSRHLRNATVVVRDGRIASVSASGSPRPPVAGAEVIDGTGLFLSPGLIDSHVHTNELAGVQGRESRFPAVVQALREQQPRSYLYFGFTTLVDVSSTPERVREWNSSPVHPDLYYCGATPIPGGYPPTYKTREEQARTYPYMLGGSNTPESVVKKMKTDGAICVKTYYERGFGETDVWPVPQLATIRALVKAAHAVHLPVLIHANSTDGQEFGVDAGVDILAHGLWHWNSEPDAMELTARPKGVLDREVRNNLGWQATMRVLAGDRDVFNPEFLSDPNFAAVVPPVALDWFKLDEGQWWRTINAPAFLPKPVLDSNDRAKQWDVMRSPQALLLGPAIERAKSAARYMVAHHARFLFGSDTPGSPSFANQPGLNGWLEMHQLIDVGLTPAQVFRAATLANADALGLARELGTIQVGKRANLLLTRQDPTLSIQAYNDIEKVIIDGRVLDRATLTASPQ